MQLHGYLQSLYANCADGEFDVSVLARIDPEYESEYASLGADVIRETDFASQVQSMVDTDAEYTMFACDDVVYTSDIEPKYIESAFRADPGLLGFSLRLGLHIHADMFGRPLQQPTFVRNFVRNNDHWTWDFTAPNSTGDWAYPWEVLGTVYRTEFVKRMVAGLGARSPSQLEERGAREWSKYTDLRRMACYRDSCLVVPTVNVIQQEFPGNGIRGAQALSPEFLLECWNQELRLDTERYKGMAPDSWRIGDFWLKRAL